MDKEEKKQHEKLYNKIQDLSGQIEHIRILIKGDPPNQKGVFQRLDETNGKVINNEVNIKKHDKLFWTIGGTLGASLATFFVWLLQFLIKN